MRCGSTIFGSARDETFALLVVVWMVEQSLDAVHCFSQLGQERESLSFLLSTAGQVGGDCLCFGEYLVGVEQQL
jgi:hypothetical protein